MPPQHANVNMMFLCFVVMYYWNTLQLTAVNGPEKSSLLCTRYYKKAHISKNSCVVICKIVYENAYKLMYAHR